MREKVIFDSEILESTGYRFLIYLQILDQRDGVTVLKHIPIGITNDPFAIGA